MTDTVLNVGSLSSLLALAKNTSPDEVQDLFLRGKSAETILEGIDRDQHCLILAEDLIVSSAEQALVTKGGNIMEVLPFIVRQQIDHPDLAYDIKLEMSEEAVAFFAESVRQSCLGLRKAWKTKNNPAASFVYRNERFAKLIDSLDEAFSDVAGSISSKPEALMRFLPLLTGGKMSGFERGVHEAYISMAVYRRTLEQNGIAIDHDRLTDMGQSALLSDICDIVEPGEHGDIGFLEKTHQATSATILEEMGFSSEITAAVRYHHTIKDSDGVPICSNKSNLRVNDYAKVLSAVTLMTHGLVDLGRDPLHALSDIYACAGKGLIDNYVAKAIGTLAVETPKDRMLRTSQQVRQGCVVDPNTYPTFVVKGGARSFMFACKNAECVHYEPTMIVLPQPLSYLVDNEHLTTEAGYFGRCEVLTESMKQAWMILDNN